MMDWIKEVCLAFGQSLRMLLAGKQTLLLLLLSFLLLTVMLNGMEEVKEEKSKIAIGIADESNSELSQSVIEGMRQKELYEIAVGEEEELLNRLKAGELSAVCVIRRTFEQNIAKGRISKLITIYETEDGSALLLSDIFAGVMMQEICTAKGYLAFEKYSQNAGKDVSLTREDYRNYVNDILAEGGTEFTFDVAYVSRENEETEKPSQAILYVQAIFAVFALMIGVISIYAVLPFRQLKHGRLARRLKTLPVHGSAVYAGSAMAGLIIPLVFGAVFLAILGRKNEMNFSQILSLLVCTGVYICVIVCMMLFAAYGIKNHTVYQMGMLAMIFVFGVFGLVSLVDGLLVPEGMATWVPNGWYVRRMTELYHQ